MKRFFAFLLTLAMVVAMLPVGTVFAADSTSYTIGTLDELKDAVFRPIGVP